MPSARTYFYVWMKRTLGHVPRACSLDELTNPRMTRLMNVARFKDMGKKGKQLATADYENKMLACFPRDAPGSGRRRRADSDVHAQAGRGVGHAGQQPHRAGFHIDASWPVHTESDKALTRPRRMPPPARFCWPAASERSPASRSGGTTSRAGLARRPGRRPRSSRPRGSRAWTSTSARSARCCRSSPRTGRCSPARPTRRPATRCR